MHILQLVHLIQMHFTKFINLNIYFLINVSDYHGDINDCFDKMKAPKMRHTPQKVRGNKN